MSLTGCVMVRDPGILYGWEDELARWLEGRKLDVLNVQRKKLADALDEAQSAFCTLNRRHGGAYCLGLGMGGVAAASVAARLPARGLALVGSPFCASRSRRLWAPGCYRRVRESLYAVDCPSLILQPGADARYPASSAAYTQSAISGACVHSEVLPETDMAKMWGSREQGVHRALLTFFGSSIMENHLRKAPECV